MKIPVTYADAHRLSEDGIGALACARMEWDRLTKREQELLRSAERGAGSLRVPGGRTTDRDKLRERGLVSPSGILTELGRLVREVGISRPVEVNHAA